MVSKLRLLEEEDPQLQVQWNETAGEIYIKVMGQVQLEVVAQMVRDRFGIAITYGQGRISYKETIAECALTAFAARMYWIRTGRD